MRIGFLRGARLLAAAFPSALAALTLLSIAVLPIRAQAQDLPSMLGNVASQVAAGNSHTCALTNESGVQCWGANDSGQLGNGSTISSSTPVDVTGLTSDVVAITAGESHTCALTMAGAVKCWGDDSSGQLGDSSTTSNSMPVAVIGLASGVAAISAGGSHTCALTTAGAVKCWGFNVHGQLGNGSTTSNSEPVAVTGLTSDVVAISAGGSHTCALTMAGALKCWGFNYYGQLGNGSTTDSPTSVDVTGLASGVVAIAAGEFHTCALSTAGAVKCWGYNSNGQLGDDSTTNRSAPLVVTSLSGGVAAIAAGEFHSCALTTAGRVKCWGYNSGGQLGNGSTTDSPIPVTVTGLGGGVAAIAAGEFHTCALTTVGGVRCWGDNNFGRLGNGTQTDSPTPVDVVDFAAGILQVPAAEASTKQALAQGNSHSCALTPTGAVKCWGNNASGQLGNGTNDPSSTPVDVTGLAGGISAISAGADHTCALLFTADPFGTNDNVKCWGSNYYGQLGNGTKTSSATPVTAAYNYGSMKAIAAGLYHTCGVGSLFGIVTCWGLNNAGQLGNGSFTDSTTPVVVIGLGATAALAAGQVHTCALTTRGAVQCWGGNGYGELGNGTNDTSPTPVAVTGLASGVAAIAAGAVHSCALTTAGAVQCWGANLAGQLGNSSTANSATPANVTGLASGVTAIAAGTSHTCALTTTGAVECWGANDHGQLGNGSTTNSSIPVGVTGLAHNVVAIAAGSSHTCALTQTGALKCWGANDQGQLGNNSTTDRHTPIVVRGGQTLAFAPALTMASGNFQILSATTSANAGARYATWTDDVAALGTCHLDHGFGLVATRAALCGVSAASYITDDGNGNNYASAPTQYRLIRIAAAIGNPPIFTSASSTTFTLGQPGSFSVSASGTPTPVLSTHGTLPAWLSLTDHGDGTATLAGTPPAGTISVTLPLSASNSAGTANQSFMLNVVAPSTYSITATANPTAGGTLSCTPNPVASGSKSTCTAAANVGYTFTSFSGDCGGASPSCTLSNVTANKTVTANFNATPPRIATMTTLIVSPNPATVNQMVTATVGVSVAADEVDSAPAPAGVGAPVAALSLTVSGGGQSCTMTLNGSGNNFNGNCALTFATPGSYAITASYPGDAATAPSSAIQNLTVNAAVAAQIVAAPTLSTWMLVLLGWILTAGAAVAQWRRQRRH